MYSIRCRCGKIVCQVANMPDPPVVGEGSPSLQSPAAVILCRHCKRYVCLQIPTITGIHFTSGVQQPQDQPTLTKS